MNFKEAVTFPERKESAETQFVVKLQYWLKASIAEITIAVHPDEYNCTKIYKNYLKKNYFRNQISSSCCILVEELHQLF